MSELPDRHAAVIGIDAYGQGLPALRTATGDARAVATALREDHGYHQPIELLDDGATAAGILRLLEDTLPAVVRPDSALVLYFAGHGVALDGDDGPRGYLLPQDAHVGKPETWLTMDRVRKALTGLPCRHLLVVLDCCFAGSFRWTSSRKTLLPALRPLYDSQYARFLEGKAWQVLTSASHGEEAQDVLPGRFNTREQDDDEEHSPFASALLAALAGASDSSRAGFEPDGVITSTELYQYVFEVLAPAGEARRQTPGLWPLRPDNTGEFIFLSPHRGRNTLPDPPLDDAHNPWLGLKSYEDDDAPLFFGRERVIEELEQRVLAGASPLITVVGASGTGKSSVVKAGLLPRLRRSAPGKADKIGPWKIVLCERLGELPCEHLAAADADLGAAAFEGRRLLVIDQFEELFTQGQDADERQRLLEDLAALLESADGRRLQVLITLRSDFEPGLRSTPLATWLQEGVFRLPGFLSSELREVIEGPAAARALYFEPPHLVDSLIDEVMAMPGGLPLLSFALSEMYRRSALRRQRTGELDRSLSEADYEATGGVVGSIHHRATELLEDADRKRGRATVRRVALRTVSSEGGRVARRRISLREIEYSDPAEQARVKRVKNRLIEARLLVAEGDYLEPAHDTLVQAWPQLTAWLTKAAGSQRLLRAVWRAAEAWSERGEDRRLLWSEDPRLPEVLAIRGELNRLEERFVDASLRRKRNRRHLMIAAVSVVLAIFALMIGSLLDGSSPALGPPSRPPEVLLQTESVLPYSEIPDAVVDPSAPEHSQLIGEPPLPREGN